MQAFIRVCFVPNGFVLLCQSKNRPFKPIPLGYTVSIKCNSDN